MVLRAREKGESLFATKPHAGNLRCKGCSLLCLTIGNDSGCAGIPKGFNGDYCLLSFLHGVVGYGNGFGLGVLNVSVSEPTI